MRAGHLAALEADFQRYYGLDFVDLWRGRLPLRKVANLAAHLPLGAEVYRAEGVDASQDETWFMLRLIEQQLSVANWQRAGNASQQPKPVPLPSEQAAESRRKQVADHRAELARQRHIKRARARKIDRGGS